MTTLRFITICLALACCTALSAQASLNFAGSATDAVTPVHRVRLDHGTTARSLTLDLVVTTTSSNGIDIDTHDLASQLGGATNTASLFLSGPGTDNNSLTTSVQSGIQDYFITVMPWGFGTSNYDLTVSLSSVPQSALIDGGTQNVSNSSGALSKIHGRALFYYGDYWNGGTDVVRCSVDFGLAAHAITAAFEFNPGFDITGLRVYEETPAGDVLLFDAGSNPFSGLALLTTGARSGTVILRVEANIGSNGSELDWNLLFPTTVTPIGRVGGPSSVATSGESSGGGGGCITNTGAGGLALLAMALVAGISLRLRRARAAQ